MTRNERDLLTDISSRSGGLPKSYFDNYPHNKTLAKRMLWDNWLKIKGDNVVLTPKGKAILRKG